MSMSSFWGSSTSSNFPSSSSNHISSQSQDDSSISIHGPRETSQPGNMAVEDEEEPRPPYVHSMIAGGMGGTAGDLLMHSLDTVKTRQQGDTHFPPRYDSMSSTYLKIYRQEGILRGLYSGVTPAFLGSFPGTVIFFGTYEYSKRLLLDRGWNPSISYSSAGLLADLAASVIYVPSEVLKTRLQLQGRYNNPFFSSGYNYRNTVDAFRTIIRTEGGSALYHGYKATIFRDLPFSALQFAFWEQMQSFARKWMGTKDPGVALDVVSGMAAGGIAGVITCPLDVVKTRIQTQVQPIEGASSTGHSEPIREPSGSTNPKHAPATVRSAVSQVRNISTSSPSTTVVHSSNSLLHTSSILVGLKLIYKTEGLRGCFRGVGPRLVWTSVQSGTMLVSYQAILRYLEKHPLVDID